MIRHYWIFLIVLSPLVFGGDFLLSIPWREHSVIVTDQGFFPDKILIFEGEKLKLFVTSTSDIPLCLRISGTEVHLKAIKGQISEGEWIFNQSGTYTMNCPGQKIGGKVVVIGKGTQKGRTIQSINDKSQNDWYPRED